MHSWTISSTVLDGANIKKVFASCIEVRLVRLYCVDAQVDYISSTDLGGANIKKFLASRIEVR